MKILFVTSEAIPYWKTGGLADVSRALPDAMAARGHDVVIIHPLYRAVQEQNLPLEPVRSVDIPWPGEPVQVRYLHHRNPDGVDAILVHHADFFDVDSPYSPGDADPMANGRRFALFCRAVVEYARVWEPDILHLNDWGTGLTPAYALVQNLSTASVFAIHNLAYQGNFPPRLLDEIGLPPEFYRTENGLEFHGTASFMKGGLALSDRLVTVSPTYAREIQTPAFGAGMDGLLHFRRRVLHGILNGLDTQSWNPATDPALSVPHDADRLGAKDRNREELLHELGLDDDGPLFVLVSRLVHQKGLDLLLEALPSLLRLPIRIAVLGDGDPAYQDALAVAVAQHPERISATFRFDDALARRFYAGADFFLMPSLFEPCGLGQMIAQRYGTPPVVRRTGGLADTVQDGVTGFTFDEPTPTALRHAIQRARRVWRRPKWDVLRRRCMALDWSWTRPAEQYDELYRMARGAA